MDKQPKGYDTPKRCTQCGEYGILREGDRCSVCGRIGRNRQINGREPNTRRRG